MVVPWMPARWAVDGYRGRTWYPPFGCATRDTAASEGTDATVERCGALSTRDTPWSLVRVLADDGVVTGSCTDGVGAGSEGGLAASDGDGATRAGGGDTGFGSCF